MVARQLQNTGLTFHVLYPIAAPAYSDSSAGNAESKAESTADGANTHGVRADDDGVEPASCGAYIDLSRPRNPPADRQPPSRSERLFYRRTIHILVLNLAAATNLLHLFLQRAMAVPRRRRRRS